MRKATNSALMKIKNEKIILSLINQGPISRVEISRKSGLTKAAVTIIVDDLKHRGIVIEKEGKSGTIGRTPVMLFLNKKSFYVVGINISRLDITMGLTDLGGNIVAQKIFPVCSPQKAFERIKTTFDEQIAESGIDISQIYRLSVVTPGPVDIQNGMILNPPNFTEWHNVPIAEKLREITGIDVVLGNVSSATAIAEKYFGAAFGTENFLTLQVDEGIGSGIVINDSLFKGSCEIGHTSIKFDGTRCECGNHGCLEKYASIPHILENTGYKNWKEVVDCEDDVLLEKEAEYLSTAIISANNIFDFDKIVICGDLTYKPQKILEHISKKMERNMLSKKKLVVCAGKVGSKLQVASAMGINEFFV